MKYLQVNCKYFKRFTTSILRTNMRLLIENQIGDWSIRKQLRDMENKLEDRFSEILFKL